MLPRRLLAGLCNSGQAVPSTIVSKFWTINALTFSQLNLIKASYSFCGMNERKSSSPIWNKDGNLVTIRDFQIMEQIHWKVFIDCAVLSSRDAYKLDKAGKKMLCLSLCQPLQVEKRLRYLSVSPFSCHLFMLCCQLPHHHGNVVLTQLPKDIP